jgi:hypothetical protein
MEKSRLYLLEYVGVIALWFLTFGKNAFSNLLFVDYVPARAGYLGRSLIVNDFTGSIDVLSILKEIFGAIGIERVFFSFAILAAMLVSYYYISRLVKGKARMLFALVFFFNPFVYTRLMVGQIGIIVAYLLIPAFLVYLFELFDRDLDKKGVLKVSIVASLIGAMTPHFFIFCFAMFIVASFWFYFYKNKFNTLKYAKMFGIFILLLLLLNLYWLQGLFTNPVLNAIDSEHESFFAPKASFGVSTIMKVFGMWGFWRENAYAHAYGTIPLFLWYQATLLLICLLLIGHYTDSETKKSKFFYTLFWIGVIFGVGISHPYTKSLFDLLFEYLPFFNGFRDSNKFVAFIALAYAYFLPKAIVTIKEKLVGWKNDLGTVLSVGIILIFVLLIFGMNFTMINLNGQVKNVDYPQSYDQVSEFLSKKNIYGEVVYLPWQEYLTYNWSTGVSSDGRISVPMNEIMPVGIIEGPDQYGGNNGFRADVSRCLEAADEGCLKEIGVEYVLHDKCAFYPDEYVWLGDKKEFESGCIDVYYIGGKSVGKKIPLRFLVGVLISLLTLAYVAFVLAMSGWHKTQEEQRRHKLMTI